MNAKNDTEQVAAEPPQGRALPQWLQVVREQVESLKFGAVQVTVHDSKVVQIERNEKMRLDRPD